MDIAKNIFQLHWVDAGTGQIASRQLKRGTFLELRIANPCLIGTEAWGGSQHWARRLIEMGDQVKLMPSEARQAMPYRQQESR
ncbi:transposase [Paraburkholderia youngii]